MDISGIYICRYVVQYISDREVRREHAVKAGKTWIDIKDEVCILRREYLVLSLSERFGD